MTLQDHFENNVRLKKEWASDRNTVTPDKLTPRTRRKVWWRCDSGHEWEATPDSRVSLGRSCPYCSNQAVTVGGNDLLAADPTMAKLWHPTRNGDLKPTDVTPGSNKRVWWQCEKGHAWRAPPYSIKAGTSCPYCSGRNPIVGETDLATTHRNLIDRWSGRNTLSPTEVTAGSHKKVWWICEKGHEWESMVVSYATDGCGCPYCAGKRAIPGETDLATMRPDLMTEWDTELNILLPTEITVASREKVWWKCKLGHSWQAMVFSRTREQSSGCPYCSGKQVLSGFNDLATLKPLLAREWYQPLNGDLTPDRVSLGSNKKVWWQCSEGHVWHAFIYARAKRNGTGCPVCAGTVKRRRSIVTEVPKPKTKAQNRKKNEHLVGINAQI